MTHQSTIRMESLRVVLEREMGSESMLNIMHKFVQAVSVMDDTILVPIRLKDMPVNRPDHVAPTLNINGFLPKDSSGDLYSFYMTLNTIKTELIGGACGGWTDQGEVDTTSDKHEAPMTITIPAVGIHNEQTKQIAAVFRHHMAGLFSTLKDMTLAANYLTSRYQEELGDNTRPSRLSSVIL